MCIVAPRKTRDGALNEESGRMLVRCGLRPRSHGDVGDEREEDFATRELGFIVAFGDSPERDGSSRKKRSSAGLINEAMK